MIQVLQAKQKSVSSSYLPSHFVISVILGRGRGRPKDLRMNKKLFASVV